MARKKQRDTQDNWTSILDSAMDNSQVNCDILQAGETGTRPEAPFYFNCEAEKLECTAIAIDTPGSGVDRLTVVRGVLGTSGASHIDATVCVQRAYASQVSELNKWVKFMQILFDRMTGGKGTGIQQTTSSAAEDFAVVAQGTPDMTFDVSAPGAGIVDKSPVGIEVDITSPVQVAPSANPRIDIACIDQDGELQITVGTESGSPSAPAIPASQMKLAEIFHRVGSVHIDDVDDSSNSFITDTRGDSDTPWL